MTVEVLSPWVFQAITGFRNAPAVSSPHRNNYQHVLQLSSEFLKAAFNSALMCQGAAHRLRGSANAVRIRAPQIGGEDVFFCNYCLFPLLSLLES